MTVLYQNILNSFNCRHNQFLCYSSVHICICILISLTLYWESSWGWQWKPNSENYLTLSCNLLPEVLRNAIQLFGGHWFSRLCRSFSHIPGWPCLDPQPMHTLGKVFQSLPAPWWLLQCHSSLATISPSTFLSLCPFLSFRFSGACPAQSGFPSLLVHLHVIFTEDTAHEDIWWEPKRLLIYLTQKHFATVLLGGMHTLFSLSHVMGKKLILNPRQSIKKLICL